MLENRHLRYFIEVAKSLHVRRAAERLHLAQPALTQNIQQLESELGVELFHRESRHLRLGRSAVRFRSKRSAGRLPRAHLAVSCAGTCNCDYWSQFPCSDRC
jgi:hypothetical protein